MISRCIAYDLTFHKEAPPYDLTFHKPYIKEDLDKVT